MAKKGMHRADSIYDKNKNRAEIVPELQRKTYFKFLFLYRQRLSKR